MRRAEDKYRSLLVTCDAFKRGLIVRHFSYLSASRKRKDVQEHTIHIIRFESTAGPQDSFKNSHLVV